MNIIGNPDPFADTFPPNLLPWVFGIIIKEWNHFPRTTRNPLENRITKPFVGHLQTCQETRQLPFVFDSNVKLVTSDQDTEIGELDIRVIHGFRSRVFFAFECKRLNVVRDGKYASQAGAYVGDEGMGCFLSGQYDGGSDSGGMIGYVMDNDVQKAVNAINKAIKMKKKNLQIPDPAKLKSSSIVGQKDNPCYETTHVVKKNDFLIYHIILPYNVKGNKNS